MPVINGTLNDDTLVGTNDDDSIYGLAGNDNLSGGEGRDQIKGDSGNDSLYGDPYLDAFNPYLGEDILRLNRRGQDTIQGGSGNDLIIGGAGKDILLGGSGNDQIWGGYSDAEGILNYSEPNVITLINFFDFRDLLIGGSGDDSLYGDSPESGDENLFEFGSTDTLIGGTGNDLLVGGRGVDYLYGGSGNDRLFADEQFPLSWTNFSDRIISDSNDPTDYLYGGSGDDYLRGSGSEEFLDGDVGNDTLIGDSESYLQNGYDTLIGGDGDDLLLGLGGSDFLNGGTGDDVLIGDIYRNINEVKNVVDTLTGGAGADQFILGTYGNRLLGDEYDAGSLYGISASYVYENNGYANEYAIITDFNTSEDVIQLANSYYVPSEGVVSATYVLGSSPEGLPQGTAIYLDQDTDVLIAIVQGVTGLSLDENYFRFVSRSS